MGQATTGGAGRRSVFLTTRWTVVCAAGAAQDTDARSALAELCRTYWYPLYAYLRRRGFSSFDAQDLVQGFFERLLERESLARVKRERGRFRSFLLAALNHHISDQRDRAMAAKRGGGRVLSLDAQEGENRYAREPADPSTPEHYYERKWALALLDTVAQRLRREYEQAGRATLFETLAFCLAGERSAIPYEDLARCLDMTEPALRVAVHRLRRRYREVLRAEIARLVSGPEEVEDEIRHLMRVLGT